MLYNLVAAVINREIMKKKFWKIFIAIIVVFGVYLCSSYTYIYYKIGAIGLKSPDNQQTYMTVNNASSTKKIIYASLGDSLTAGVGTTNYEESYPYLLAKSLTSGQQQVVLKNFSVPGFRTSDLIASLLAPAIAAKPDIITLLIGVNDVHGSVLANTFRKNYEYILRELTAKTQAQIYVINIPSIGADTLMLPPYDYYYNQRTKEFNEIIRNLAQSYKVKYIDLYSPTVRLLKEDGPHYAADLFHPSASGYALWAKIIYDDINQ